MRLDKICTTAAISAAMLISPAQATLIALDGQQVLDTATNLVWLHDWGLGGGDWQSSMNWADTLSVAGHDDWFLPSIDQYQFVWASAGGSYAGLLMHFDNVDPYAAIGITGYWSSTLAASGGGGSRAEIFLPEFGSHYNDYTFWIHSATAVRMVPEPATFPLAALALLAGLGARWRRPTRATASAA